MENLNNLLIYTVAAGHYRDYVPLFKRCLELQYPEYDYIVDEIETDNPILAATLRFLLEPLGKHKYVYITDVDMFILREKPTLLDFHLKEMKEQGLCYSNSRRKREPRGSERITGLHFVEREPWYKATSEARRACLKAIKTEGYYTAPFSDELMLQRIVLESGLDLCGRTHLASRHHGIHIGLFKHYRLHSRETIKQQLTMRISPPVAQKWIQNYSDPEFAKIEVETRKKNKIIADELERLYAFCRKREKQIKTWGKKV